MLEVLVKSQWGGWGGGDWGGGREDEVCGVGGEEGAGEGVTDRGRFVGGDDVGHLISMNKGLWDGERAGEGRKKERL
jgi:hypothetical protein